MSLILFTVQGYHQKDDRIGLLPGVSRDLLTHPNVAQLKQGSKIELFLPNGETISTVIEDYYFRVPIDSQNRIQMTELPIIIALPKTFTEDDVPIGSLVQLPVSI